ncbi:MAG TPA: hypothetical protein VL860_07355, partial [Planctomycetota bacterium]|nr:hypothetical protein [Planctomycetota bacterium]
SWAIGLITAFLVMAFWVTMASHCWAARPKMRYWRWITVALPLLGALAYFFWVYWRRPRRPFLSMSLLQNLRASGLRAAIQDDLTATTPKAPAAPVPGVPGVPAATGSPAPAAEFSQSPPAGGGRSAPK